MKKINLIILALLLCTSFFAQKRSMTADDLWAMKRVGNVAISPDGKTLAYTVQSFSMEENKGNTDIYLINSDGTNCRAFKNTEKNESQPKFHPDGKSLSFIKGGQLYLADLDGNNERKITDFYSGVSGVVWSKDGSKIIFVSSVYPDLKTQEENKLRDEEREKSKITAKVFTELMYKTWNDWRGDKRGHLFLYNLQTKEYSDLTHCAYYDVPPIDLGSNNDYSFSPEGDEVAFTANLDKQVALSTNNDVHIIRLEDLNSGLPVRIKTISVSKGNDNQPAYSPDGQFIAYRSMERAGFEADKHRLVIYDRKNGKNIYVSDNLDISFGDLTWTNDSKNIYYNAANQIYNSIYKFQLNGFVNSLIKKEVNAGAILLCPADKYLFFAVQKSKMPHEIFSLKAEGNELKQLTFTNKELLSKIEMTDLETIWVDGAEGAKVQSLLVKPPFFDPNKKYPVMFLIHGGPQGHWTDDFHYRWNPQMFAAQGYLVIAPNPRGSVGYGQKFTDEISGDWGGKVFTDIMNTVDYVAKNIKYADADHFYAAGASYGGYMMNWMQGHTDRFKTLICHAGVYNLESMYGVTEEIWFPEWEYKGTPWSNPDMYAKWSPHKYVNNFKTPMLVLHGGMDFRVPEGQAFELFTALQRQGIESKLIYFPDEFHFVVKPQNAKFWWSSIFEWLEKFNKR